MKKRTKIFIAAAAAAVLVCGIVATVSLTRRRDPVEVVSVGDLQLGGMPDGLNAYGTVATESSQQVLYRSDQKIEKIYVTEGDHVEVGDPLLQYDVTMNSIQLRLKKLELNRLELEMKKAKEQIQTLQNTKPTEPAPEPAPAPEPEPEPPAVPPEVVGADAAPYAGAGPERKNNATKPIREPMNE